MTNTSMEAFCSPDNIDGGSASGSAQQGRSGSGRDDRPRLAGRPCGALAGDRENPAGGTLPAATGASGDDPEARRHGERALGIPTVLDRTIQQAVLQQLQPLWDPTFSEHSYGFRPGRSAHQAVSASAKPTSSKAISSLWILIWRNFLTGSITTD